jgi:hypothetical protein
MLGPAGDRRHGVAKQNYDDAGERQIAAASARMSLSGMLGVGHGSAGLLGIGTRTRSYASLSRSGSVTMNASAGRGEIWLRGNLRPAVGLVLVALVVTCLGVAAALVGGAPPVVAWTVAGAGAAAVAAAALLATAAARPRLERHGSSVRVRLAPLTVHDVPLEVVECVFRGSLPLAGEAAAAPAEPPHRVATLVLRIAERATAWQARPTFRSWGTWEGGSIVLDGRWCEPLTGDVTSDVARRLLEAKRAVAQAAEPSPGCAS